MKTFKLFLFSVLVQPYAHGLDIDGNNNFSSLINETFTKLQGLISETQETINSDFKAYPEHYDNDFSSLFGKVEKKDNELFPLLETWIIVNLYIDGTSEDKARYSTLRKVFQEIYEQGFFFQIIFLKKEAKFDLNFFNTKYFDFYEKYLSIFTQFITSLQSIIHSEKDSIKKTYYEIVYQRIQKMALIHLYPKSFFKVLVFYSFLNYLIINKTSGQESFDKNIVSIYNETLKQYKEDLEKSFLKKLLTQFHLIKSPEENINQELSQYFKIQFINHFNYLLPFWGSTEEDINLITFLIQMSLIYSPTAEKDLSKFFTAL